MPTIDVHAHVAPERFKAAIQAKGEWYGLPPTAGELHFPGQRMTPEERIADMTAIGVDMQLISPLPHFYQYANELKTTQAIARECNDDIADTVARFPDHFAGLGTLPMQDISAAVAELERIMTDLSFKGVIIGDHVNGHTYDEPEFLPFFKAAEGLGAILFFHQGDRTIVMPRINRYHLYNAIGNPTERTITYACLVYGGVIDKCPDLKPVLAHAGGHTAFAAQRMDKTAGVFEDGPIDPRGYASQLDEDQENAYRIPKAPSSYLGAFYYDCCLFSGAALRFLIDQVGIERVVLGSDYPTPMVLKNPVTWINGLDCLTAEEKIAILSRNPARVAGL
jgi:aminocarboxymuconate-semialdehyde decarboxylase